VLLFDIDGTLVSTGGAGRRSIDRAFGQLHGRADACSHFSFDGMTDRAIARRGLEQVGVEATAEAIEALLSTYVTALKEEVRRTPPERYRVHPGTREAIAAGHAAGCAVGLGTGNIRAGAEVKLGHVGLMAPFAFGGFGDDHEARPELIRVGAERGARQLGVAREAARVVVIGDTPKDVEAAHAIGAQSVAVATGTFDLATLQQCRPTFAFEHLAVPGALEAVLGLQRSGRK
jgi:phosphoglycolate phosphatase-like HAD superfamily hydrolase